MTETTRVADVTTETAPTTAGATPAEPAWLALNRANWNQRVPIHAASRAYDLTGFVADGRQLPAFEVEELGDVAGKSLLHLQCHIGTDTLSWARAGATVTGLDFSAAAIEVARGLAEEIGAADARFVVSDVYNAPDALGHAVYDVVYTGLGALCWLPDIERWARTVAELIAPGGCLYLVEFHPVTDMFDENATTVRFDYFDADAQVWDNDHTYTDGDKLGSATVTHQFAHTLGTIISSLIAAGLRLEFLHEYDFTMFPRFAELEQHAGGFSFPAGQPRMPLLYSLRATKANI
ncbi:class I SAM-dependent methyltransferase [Actinospica robiniae]|uniref:class I SAM-dependent methyltransferase n=1 Tax=Actinospica robiniae TaxID=304901 RepID=UPI001FDF191B|nr:class I SAM-dependent methyltransferase [Actinospica robiniae]